MPITIPGKAADTLASLDTERSQQIRDSPGAFLNVDIGASVDRPLDRARHDLAVRMCFGRVLDQRGNEQRMMLHQAQHSESPRKACGRPDVYANRSVCPTPNALAFSNIA
jgi:hypothetical protein